MTDSAVQNGQAYQYRVRAKASINNVPVYSEWSPYVTGVPIKPASAPAFQAESQDGRVQLTWVKPDDLGGAVLQGYSLKYYPTNDPSDFTMVGLLPSTTRFGISLPNGTEYTFELKAITNFGQNGIEGDTATATATPSAPPGAPTDVDLNGAPSQLTVTWTAPNTTGSVGIQHYIVEFTNTTVNPSESDWVQLSSNPTGTTATITEGLVETETYIVRVAAVNTSGQQGPWSPVSDSAIPGPLPSKPVALSSIPGDQTIDFSWSPPVELHGLPVLGYEYEIRTAPTDPAEPWPEQTTSVIGTSVTRGQLVNGTAYEFRVRARTGVGLGPWSEVVTETPTGVPGVPTNLTGAASSGRANLSWILPDEDGGVPLIRSAVQYRVKGAADWSEKTFSTVSSGSVTSLQNGARYEFQVKVGNAGEYGDWSSSFELKIGDVPGVPPNVYALRTSDGKVTVGWHDAEAPADSPILKYVIQYQFSNATEYDDLDENAWSIEFEAIEPANHKKLNISQSGRCWFRVFARAETGDGSPGSFRGRI
jgi:titin